MSSALMQQLFLSRTAPQRRDKSNILWYSFLIYQSLSSSGLLQRYNNGATLPRATVALAVTTFVLHYFGGEIQTAVPTLHVAADTLPSHAIQPASVIYGGQWSRLYTGIMYHIDDSHLYYNIISLLYKGTRLEDMLGTRQFAQMSVILVGLTGLTHTSLAYLLSTVGLQKYMTEYSVGLSGLLFAYKVVLSHYNRDADEQIMGIRVAAKYASWLELLVVYMVAPHSSLLGHVSGILAGLLYVQATEYMTRQHVHQGNVQRGFRMGNNYTINDYVATAQRKLHAIFKALQSIVFGSGSGSGTASRAGRPSPSSSAQTTQTPLTQAMSALREAGFRDLRANAAALRQTNNNVDAAVEILLRTQ